MVFAGYEADCGSEFSGRLLFSVDFVYLGYLLAFDGVVYRPGVDVLFHDVEFHRCSISIKLREEPDNHGVFINAFTVKRPALGGFLVGEV